MYIDLLLGYVGVYGILYMDGEKMTADERANCAVILFLFFVYGLGVLTGMFSWSNNSVRATVLIKSGRCEYQADPKTGEVRMVWSDTKQPVEGESK